MKPAEKLRAMSTLSAIRAYGHDQQLRDYADLLDAAEEFARHIVLMYYDAETRRESEAMLARLRGSPMVATCTVCSSRGPLNGDCAAPAPGWSICRGRYALHPQSAPGVG